MYTGTFTFRPADEDWIYDQTRNPYHNCPAHHQFEVNLVSWRFVVSEIELTYDDTGDVMIKTDKIYPAVLPIDFANQKLKFLSPLFGLVMTVA